MTTVTVTDTEIQVVTVGVQGPAGGGGSSDHGALSGLADDDHAQYYNQSRGDARYSQLGHTHATSDITSGTFADARIAASNVTQHQAALAIATSQLTGTVATSQIANDAVTYAKMQNVSATDKLLGRLSSGSGDVEEITCTAAGRALIDDSTAAAQRVTLGVSSRAIIFGAVTPGNDTLYLTTYAPFAFTIDSVQNIQTSAGTITAAVKINGTNVTGLSAISVTSSSQDVSASGANSVAVGDEVTVVLSSNSSAANLRGTILITA